MQAIQVNRYGSPEEISVNEIPQPELQAGQVLVAVHAASLNAIDRKLHSGELQQMAPLSLPVTLGSDFSGVIQEVASDVTDFKPGDEVYGLALVISGGSGSFAQYATTTASNIAHKPASLSHEAAASMAVVGTTAVRVVEEFINPHPDQSVLILGGTGGVGSVALQYLKYLGATVIVTVQNDQAVAFANQLGADAVVKVEQDSDMDKLHNYDIVFDTVGGSVYERSFSMVKKGGLVITMSEMPNDTLAQQYDVSVISIVQQKPAGTMTQSLDHLSELLEDEQIHPYINKAFPLAEGKDAFVYYEQQRPQGKIIITCL